MNVKQFIYILVFLVYKTCPNTNLHVIKMEHIWNTDYYIFDMNSSYNTIIFLNYTIIIYNYYIKL